MRIKPHVFNQTAHETFALMRSETPVCRVKLSMFSTAYFVTRYDDVAALLVDQDRIIKNRRNATNEAGKSSAVWLPAAFAPLLNNMLSTDEPDHRRLRNLVHLAFTPAMIRKLEPSIEQIAERLLRAAMTQGQADLVSQFALQLPVTVITEMIGIPESDREMFQSWARRILVAPTPLNMIRAIGSIRSFIKYIRKLAEVRRRDPQDDLLSRLALAEADGEVFTEDELIGMTFLLLVAGYETTVGLIANGTLALLRHREQFDRLKSDGSLLDSAIEEMLRFDGPLQTTEQSFARKTFELHGVTIPQGATVYPCLLSANRDESVFDNPNHFKIDRTPNKHLAFGKGIHYCLGAPLARLEAKIAFTTLMRLAPDLQLAEPIENIRYGDVLLLNRVKELPVRFT